MASNFVDLGKVQGYIIDPAALIFERKDGKTFLMKNGTSGSVSTTKDNITISNGWIMSPQIVLDTTSSDTISYTSNLTDLWLIAGVNNAELVKGSKVVRDGDYYQVEAASNGTNGTFDIEGEVDNIYIDGLVKDTTLSAGKFTVATASGKTTVTVLLSDIPAGSDIPVFYDRTKTSAYSMNMKVTQPSAVGKLTRVTPIYASEDDGAAISAYIYDTFSKVKVTGVPGFDGSYKSESTATIEFQSVAQKAANAITREIVIA